METSTAPAKEKSTRIRVSHPKVRSGCITCKIRRLKCDETKPECLRCIRFEGRCDGYAPPKGKRWSSGGPSVQTHTKAPPRKLVPLALKHDSNFIRSFDDRVKFRNEQEHLAYLTFKELTTGASAGICGSYPSTLWDTVIQGCQKDDFIRDAVTAVGALMTCGCERKLVQDSDNRTVRTPLQAMPRYQFALKQYGRAVKKMREKASCGEQGLRSVLIGCILVMCFEACLGNHVKALAHAVGGHSILRSWLTSQEQRSAFLKKEIASPAEHIIEDELVQAFLRLDMQIVTYTADPRPIHVHRELHAEGAETIYNMPSTFSSLGDARMYLDLVQRRTWHFILMVEAELYQKLGVVKYDFPINKNVASMRLTDWGPGPRMSDGYLMHSGEILRWQSSFKNLYRSIPRSSKAWKAASVLLIQSETTKMGLHGTQNREESCWDCFTPDFSRVVSLAKEVFDDEFLQTWHGFSFDGGVIKPLWMIASYCREPTIRRDAIALMRRVAVKELFWDALLHASACEVQMLSEEEGMNENGFIPESERFKIVGGSIDGLHRIGTITIRKIGKREDGTVDERTFTSSF